MIVPETVMRAFAARLTRPVPPPVAPASLPVPPTIVWVISRKSGAFAPAADEPPGEILPTMLSCSTSVLPSSNVSVRTSQLSPHALKATHWKATWPTSLIVALPHEPPGTAPPTSTNVAWYGCVVEAVAGAASTSVTAAAARRGSANASGANFFIATPSV